MTASSQLSSADRAALAQSIGQSLGASSAASLSAAERDALAQSLPGSAVAPAPSGSEAAALSLSLGNRGVMSNSEQSSSREVTVTASEPKPLAGDRSILNAAVLAAVELAKGHQATAAFVLQTKASNDPELRQAFLAGDGTASANNLTQAAAAEIAAFLNVRSSRG